MHRVPNVMLFIIHSCSACQISNTQLSHEHHCLCNDLKWVIDITLLYMGSVSLLWRFVNYILKTFMCSRNRNRQTLSCFSGKEEGLEHSVTAQHNM